MTVWEYATNGYEVVEAFKDRVKGKTIVITGPGSGGIGAETAIALARASPKLLVLTGRTESKITPVMAQIAAENPNVATKYISLDLGSQASVRAAAAQINEIVSQVDILINNAGIMATPYRKTEDGVESQFATNHVGHFLLTGLLMDKILTAAEKDGWATVVNVSSIAMAYGMHWDDVNFDDGKTYDPGLAYGQSKMANVLFSKSLARKLKSKKITSFSLHPGSIPSGLQVFMNADPKARDAAIAKAIAFAAKEGVEFVLEPPKTLQQGCATTLIAALDPSLESESGAYLKNGVVAPEQPKKEKTTVEEQDRLWALSEELIGQKFDF